MRPWDSFVSACKGKGDTKKNREKKDTQKTRERERGERERERERERDGFLVLCDHEEDGDGWDDREE